MAPPSPSTMPLRSAEKGRQVSGATTRMASQALRPPKNSGASLPPASAMGAAPERTIQKAWPMAWADDEQAVETVYVGPWTPYSIEMWLAPALSMLSGMVSGFTRGLPWWNISQ